MRSRIVELEKLIWQTQHQLKDYEAELEELYADARRLVRVERNEHSLTLVCQGRRLNARKNRYGRYTVKEKGRVLISEFWGGINDLKLNMGLGLL